MMTATISLPGILDGLRRLITLQAKRLSRLFGAIVVG